MNDGWNDFRRAALEDQEALEKGRRSGGGGGGNFKPWEMETFVIKPGDVRRIRFLKPERMRPYIHHNHWFGYPRACTRETPGFDGRCVYCYYYDKAGQEARTAGVKNDSPLYRSTSRVMEVIDFSYWHIVPDPQKDGKKTVARCSHNEAQVTRNRCRLCTDSDASIAERHFGGHKAYELNKTTWAAVFALNEKMSRSCVHYENGRVCGGTVYPIEYLCGACGHVFLTEEDIQRRPAPEVDAIVNNRLRCPGCGIEEYPVEQAVCDRGGGAHDPVRQSMFDKVIEVTCSGEKGKDGKARGTVSFNDGAPLSSVADDIAEHGFSLQEIEAMCAPLDFGHRYRAERKNQKDFGSPDEYVAAVLAAQAESLKDPQKYPNPYAGTGGTSASRPFQSRGMRSFR